jgi:prepilin-type N-terminal cleavage/methylation domain-containing protein
MKNRGFTMLELLLGLAIMGFALTGMLALYTNCMILNQSNRNSIVAISHAQYVMEELKAETSLANLETKINSGIYTKFTDLSGENTSVCCCDASNNCYSSCPTQDPQKVCVTDSWNERGTRPMSVSLQTLFTY